MSFSPRSVRGLLSVAAVGWGSLAMPGCEKPRSSSEQPFESSRAADLAPTATTVAKVAKSVSVEVAGVYGRQNASGPLLPEEAKDLINSVCGRLAEALPKQLHDTLPPAAQADDFSLSASRMALSERMLELGFKFNVGARAIKDSDRAYFTCEISELAAQPSNFAAPSFQVGSVRMPDISLVSIRQIEKELIGPYDSAPGNRITGQYFVMPGQYIPHLDTVFISSDALRTYSVQSNRPLDELKSSVILNELARASFERFLAHVENPHLLRIELSRPGKPIWFLNIHQVSEAFSDYVSLRYGDDLHTFLQERSDSTLDEYALSEFLFRNGLAAVYEANPPIIPAEELNRTTLKEAAAAVGAYLKEHPQNRPAAQQLIADTYATALEGILKSISDEK